MKTQQVAPPRTRAGSSARLLVRPGSQLALLTLALTAAVYAKTALGPLLEVMRGALTLSDNQLALLQGPALALPMLMLAVPLGLVIDRHSRTKLLFFLVFVSAVGSLLTSLATSFGLLFAARSLVGTAAFAINTTALSLLGDLYPPAQRGRAGSVILAGQFAGMSAVFAVGGILVAAPLPAAQAWRSAMLWLSLPLVLVTLVMLALREPHRAARPSEDRSVRQSLQQLWLHRGVVAPLALGKVMALIALHSAMIWAASIFARGFALTPDRAGAIVAIVAPVGGIAGTVAAGFIADFCQRTGGPRRTVAVISVLAAAAAPSGVFAVMPTVMSASILLTVLIAAITAVVAITATVFIVALPSHIRGLCLGVLTGVAVAIAFGLAPLTVSLLSAALGGPLMIGKALAFTCTGAALLCAAIFVIAARYVSMHRSPQECEAANRLGRPQSLQAMFDHER